MSETRASRPIAVPGGTAMLVGEVACPVAARPEEEVVLQHLEAADGPLLRVGYRRAGRVLRGPVSVVPGEFAALLAQARAAPAMRGLVPPS